MPRVKIWQAPFKALFSLSFYRDVLETPLRTAIAYVALLAFLAAIAGGAAFNRHTIPQIRSLTDWVKTTMPPLAYTPQGLQMKADSPYVMKHPQYGPLVRIDLSKTVVERKDFEEGNWVVLTAKYGVLRAQNRERRFDYSPEGKSFEPVPITGEMIERFSKMIRQTLTAVVPAAIFVYFFLWKLTSAMVYSSFALLINRFRREPLSYSGLFTLSCFAMTAFVLIELATFFLPKFEIRGGFFTGLAVTLLYLSIALLKTENTPAEIE